MPDRLEALAQPGGIVVSVAVRDAIAGKLAASFADLGMKTLKNIEQPVKASSLSAAVRAVAATPSVPDRPSIAVLPFENMSDDPQQAYFSDGVTDDIITELSRFRSLFVIARNYSFAFRGERLGITEIARRLGVQFILEGSVRRAGNRVRITAQLINAASGAHLWAERYDRQIED